MIEYLVLKIKDNCFVVVENNDHFLQTKSSSFKTEQEAMDELYRIEKNIEQATR